MKEEGNERREGHIIRKKERHCKEEKGGGREDKKKGVGIIIIFINCNWVVTRWQWLFYMYTNMGRKSN
jgi:hypothetical protein